MLIASFVGSVALFRNSIFNLFRKKTKGDPKDPRCKDSQGITSDDKSE
jgi:hypothetical protein